MLKAKFAVLSLGAAAFLCWQVAGVSTVNSGIVDPCNSTASSAAGAVFACPAGDGDALSANGLTISVTIHDNTNAPVPGIPASDFWLIGCNDGLTLCGGSGSSNATGATDVNGNTTIAGVIAAGGCDTGVRVVCQGIVLGGGACAPLCLPIAVHTPDLRPTGTTDGVVGFADFSAFGGAFPPNGTYDACADYKAPFGSPLTLSDFTAFAPHYLAAHHC
jgi:hypothetical protein